MVKKVVLVSSDADQEFAYALRTHIDDNYTDEIEVIEYAAIGREKLENKFKDPDHVVMLWSVNASEDTDFLLSVLQAERVQMEQRIVKCVNVRLEVGVKINHLKQECHILKHQGPQEGLDPTGITGLTGKIKAVINDRNSKVTERIGNVSEGLVWNYFVVYLKSILPELPESVLKWSQLQENGDKTISRKFMLVVPQSGKCHGKFTSAMPGAEVFQTHESKLDSYWVNDAGIQDRPFTPNVHQVRSGADSQDWFYFSGEFCNPVNTIYQLEHDYNKVNPEERKELIDRFTKRLEYILGHKDNARHKINNTYHIIQWDDENGTGLPLNELIINAIKASR